MSDTTHQPFNKRAFVSVLVGFSFILMAVTGGVLFFAPSCRIARETSWSFLGHSKDQLVARHKKILQHEIKAGNRVQARVGYGPDHMLPHICRDHRRGCTVFVVDGTGGELQTQRYRGRRRSGQARGRISRWNRFPPAGPGDAAGRHGDSAGPGPATLGRRHWKDDSGAVLRERRCAK